MLFKIGCSIYGIFYEKIVFYLNKRSEIRIFLAQQTVGNREPLFPTVCWEKKILISDRLLQENTNFSQDV